MVHKVRMPRIDPNVEEGAIGKWLAQIGSPVSVGQPLVEIITDKATFELEAEEAAILRAQVASEKSVVPVGCVIALMSDHADEALPDVTEENNALRQADREALLPGTAPPSPALPPEPAGRTDGGPGVKATPAARRLAATAGLSLTEVTPSGHVVRREDVEAELDRRQGGQR